jgi:hypothetical protein
VDDTLATNDNHSNEGFRAIADLMHLYPLWAAAVHHNVFRFTDTDGSQCTPTMPRSNAAIESRFRLVLISETEKVWIKENVM